MKSYCCENESKEESEKYEFIKKYAEWMEKPQGECPYSDPDEASNNSQFYNKITEFLNKQKNIYNKELEFIEPTDENDKPGDRTITVKKGKDAYLYLTSDQFGFSANKKGIYDEKNHRLNEKYPFVKYVKKFDGYKSLVGETIWYTRTIGGSFLWPKVGSATKWDSPYNRTRGVRFYIEDRVDLTLYEIKEYLDYKNKRKQGLNTEEPKNNFLYNAIKKADKKEASECKNCKACDKDKCHKAEGNELKKWFSLFDSFKTYVDFFCFNDFVNSENEEFYPKDIFTGESIKDIEKYREGGGKYKFIQKKDEDTKKDEAAKKNYATKEDLEKAFHNLIAWTVARSVRMEIIISNKQ